MQDGGGGGHSVFTAALLDGLGGLADGNADEVVTFRELFNYVGRRVEGETSSRQTPTRASLRGDGGGSVAFFRPDVRPAEMTAQERLRALQLTKDELVAENERLSDLVTLGDLTNEAKPSGRGVPRGRRRCGAGWVGRGIFCLNRLSLGSCRG